MLKLEGEGIGAGSAQIDELLEEVESILLLSASYCELGGEGSGAGAATTVYNIQYHTTRW